MNWVMLALSFVSLVGFAIGGLLVMQAQARQQRSKQRLHNLVAPYRKDYVEMKEVFRPAERTTKSLADSVAGVFGFHTKMLDQYPVKWWIVIGVSFFLARIIAGFIVDVVGMWGLFSWPVLWVGMCRGFFGQVVGHRRKLLFKQFPDALAMIVRSARVGIPVLGAIDTVARESQPPTSLEFTKFANELAVGIPLDEAVAAMGERTGLAEYRFFAIAIGLQSRSGGGLSETLENLADVIRQRLALKERGRALSSEATTSAWVLGALPIVCGAGIWALNPAYMSVLLTTSTGRAILGSAVLSLCVGGAVMQIIIKKSLS
jgi:tight adherence protein B